VRLLVSAYEAWLWKLPSK